MYGTGSFQHMHEYIRLLLVHAHAGIGKGCYVYMYTHLNTDTWNTRWLRRRLVTLAQMRVLSIDFNVCPHNPGQPAESAKPVHRIWCMEFKINFMKIVTNLLCVGCKSSKKNALDIHISLPAYSPSYVFQQPSSMSTPRIERILHWLAFVVSCFS